MGITSQHSFGRSSRLYVAKETVARTWEKPASTDSVRILKPTISIKPVRNDEITSYMASRTPRSRVQGKTEISWTIDAEWIPSGTKNVAPDIGRFVEALFGTETVGANNVVYSLSSSQVLKTLTFLQQVENFQQSIWGCVVDEMSLSFKGGETPKVSFNGRAMGWAQAGYGVLDKPMSGAIASAADGTGGKVAFTTTENHEITTGQVVTISGTADYDGSYTATSTGAKTFTIVETYTETKTGTWKKAIMEMGSAYYQSFMENSLVQVGTDDNSGDGFQVISTDGAGEYELEAVASGADAADVIPFVPTFSPNGVPMTGLNGTITWDALSLAGPCTEFNLSVKSGNKYNDDAAFQEYIDDAIAGIFDISGSIALRVRKSELLRYLDRGAYGTKAIEVVSGGAAGTGTQLAVSCPQCEQGFNDFDIPESEEVTYALDYKALDSASLDDACELTHS